MHPCRVISAPAQGHSRCLDKFGIEPEEMLRIGFAAAAARNEKTDLMPKFSGGMLAHIYGVEQLKATFSSVDGYQLGSLQGIDFVWSKERDLKIMFQNVDIAGSDRFEPEALSAIGDIKVGMVEGEQQSLFAEFDEAERQRKSKLNEIFKAQPWFVMVSYSEDGEPALEVSQPRSVEGGNFAKNFVERIFINREDDPVKLLEDDSDDNKPTDIKPVITKKR